ncbi:MAG: amino acid adenylation domain-containing protein, partial [Chloroflexota bacterium]
MNNNLTIPAMFSAQVQRNPGEIAVKYLGESITYDELNSRSNQLARYLLSLGLEHQALVGICLERSIDLIVSILGVLKAGAAYVPIDPAYPAERINYLLEDSDVKTLITSSNLLAAADFKGNSFYIDLNRAALEQMEVSNPAVLINSQDLAYVMYTSGSTGRPKGVMVQHSGWMNYIPSAIKTYQLKPGERVLQFASISWDTSAEEIFPCLCSGASLVLRSDDMIDSIPGFIQQCSDLHITYINIPTAFWHELVNQLDHTALLLPDFLRVLIIGGEKAQWQYLEKFFEFSRDRIQIYNTYGQTECTAVTTCIQLTRSLEQGVVPLGEPVVGVSIQILDEQLLPVPDGTPGELFVGGEGLARGYFKQPELTAQTF